MSALPCLVASCFAFASYVAIGDEAKYGHVCSACWLTFTDEERACYVKIVPSQRRRP